MNHRITICLALAGATMPAVAFGAVRADTAHRTASVQLDSARHLVIVRTGPWDVPQSHGDHSMMMHDMMSEPPQQQFTWPVTGWLRVARLRIVGEDGSELPRTILHHLTLINYGRRQLFYAIPERMIAIGRETEDIKLPSSVGVPVTAGMPMGINFAWHNATPRNLRRVTIELAIEWMPSNTVPRPVSVIPVHMGVGSPVANDPGIDLPPGLAAWSAEYAPPIAGRIIAAGGHEHDYGTGITLDDITTAKIRQVLRINTRFTASGELISMQRLLPGVTGDGIKLDPAHRYRITGTYDNRTGKTLVKGAMVHLALLFAPERMTDWPAINADDADWKRDVAALTSLHRGGMEH